MKQKVVPVTDCDYKQVIVQQYDKDDYAVVFTDNPDDENEGYSVRAPLKDLLEELISMPDQRGNDANFVLIVKFLLLLDEVDW